MDGNTSKTGLPEKLSPCVTTCHNDQTMRATGSTANGCRNAADFNLLQSDSSHLPLRLYTSSFSREQLRQQLTPENKTKKQKKP